MLQHVYALDCLCIKISREKLVALTKQIVPLHHHLLYTFTLEEYATCSVYVYPRQTTYEFLDIFLIALRE